MIKNSIKSVMEGAFDQTPLQINYYPIGIALPENAHVFTAGNRKFVLYGFARRSKVSIVEPNTDWDKIEGWNLDKGYFHNKSISEIFNIPRSIITEKGRIYVVVPHGEHCPYVQDIENIWEDCRKIFRNGMNPYSIHRNINA